MEGLPSRDLVVFWSGDVATLIRTVKTKVGNIEYYVLLMIPSQQMLWRYDDLKGQLQYKGGVLSGFIIREYPAEYVFNVSFNPELPMLICICNFDGTISLDTELHKQTEKIKGLKKDVNNYLGESETLREKYKELTEYIRELKGVTA